MGRSEARITRAHMFVKGSCAGIGLDYHPNSAKTSGLGRRPREQRATNSRSKQGRLDKELQQVCVPAGDLDLSQSNSGRIALGHLKVRGLEVVETQRQFSPASCHEGIVVTPNGLRTEAQFTRAWEFVSSDVAELDHPGSLR